MQELRETPSGIDDVADFLRLNPVELVDHAIADREEDAGATTNTLKTPIHSSLDERWSTDDPKGKLAYFNTLYARAAAAVVAERFEIAEDEVPGVQVRFGLPRDGVGEREDRLMKGVADIEAWELEASRLGRTLSPACTLRRRPFSAHAPPSSCQYPPLQQPHVVNERFRSSTWTRLYAGTTVPPLPKSKRLEASLDTRVPALKYNLNRQAPPSWLCRALHEDAYGLRSIPRPPPYKWSSPTPTPRTRLATPAMMPKGGCRWYFLRLASRRRYLDPQPARLGVLRASCTSRCASIWNPCTVRTMTKPFQVL